MFFVQLFIIKCFVIIFSCCRQCAYVFAAHLLCNEAHNTHLITLLVCMRTCSIRFGRAAVLACILNVTVAFSHLRCHSKASSVIMYHPNVCSTLVKNPKQTFSAHHSNHTEPVPLDLYPVTSHPSNSHLWDSVTLFSSLPTALTAWIKSTVTCVTTSPILLQT